MFNKTADMAQPLYKPRGVEKHLYFIHNFRKLKLTNSLATSGTYSKTRNPKANIKSHYCAIRISKSSWYYHWHNHTAALRSSQRTSSQSGSLLQGAISKDIYFLHPALKNTLLPLDKSHQAELNAGQEMTVRSHSERIDE